MKKTILSIFTLLTFGLVSAQLDPQQQPVKPATQKDTVTTDSKIKQETDPKTMDAVKTKDHPKTTKKPETTANDSVQKKKNMRK